MPSVLPSAVKQSLDMLSLGGVSLGRETLFIVQPPSCVRLFVSPWTALCQASLSFTISQSLLKHKSIESVMQSNPLVFSCPLSLLPSIFARINLFQ